MGGRGNDYVSLMQSMKLRLEMHKLKEFNFGEFDARKEYNRDKSYFLNTFLNNDTFPLENLKANNKFIIIGHKGTGKTAVGYFLSDKKKQKDTLLISLASMTTYLRKITSSYQKHKRSTPSLK